METEQKGYDCAIVGGGLAGLCLAVQLARRGISVVVFEKNTYPFHKVCGEYISMESRDFLVDLGLPWHEMNLPVIKKLGISSQSGFLLEHTLDLGGFGISRFTLDMTMRDLAVGHGAKVIEQCKVSGVARENGLFQIKTPNGNYHARIVCGSYGKYTPQFVHLEKKGLDGQYIGVKYHIKTDLPPDRIELHNFRNGYCGVSKVDKDCYCMCYLSSAQNLIENGRDIRQMEEKVLYKNPHLRRYFRESEFVDRQPLVISNVQFRKRQTQADGIFLLGDAAGSITPLCGNGMSMGMRASKMLADELTLFFESKLSETEVARNYALAWEKAFGHRVRAGFYLQGLFGKNLTTDLALRFLNSQSWLTGKLVGLTHGQPFRA